MKYVCSICGYVYDEAKEGTPFAGLPDAWACPVCGAGKSAFTVKDQEKPDRPGKMPQIPGKELESRMPLCMTET